MARPRKHQQKLNQQINFRITEDTNDGLLMAANELGVSPSDLARISMSLGLKMVLQLNSVAMYSTPTGETNNEPV